MTLKHTVKIVQKVEVVHASHSVIGEMPQSRTPTQCAAGTAQLDDRHEIAIRQVDGDAASPLSACGVAHRKLEAHQVVPVIRGEFAAPGTETLEHDEVRYSEQL
jgi:hypothetical protein